MSHEQNQTQTTKEQKCEEVNVSPPWREASECISCRTQPAPWSPPETSLGLGQEDKRLLQALEDLKLRGEKKRTVKHKETWLIFLFMTEYLSFMLEFMCRSHVDISLNDLREKKNRAELLIIKLLAVLVWCRSNGADFFQQIWNIQLSERS